MLWMTTSRFFNNLGMIAAILLLPLFSYGAALMLDRQEASVVNRQALVEAPIPNQSDLPEELKATIAAAIAQAHRSD